MKKTLFIGLGGCGLQTVSQLSKKLAAQESEDAKYMYLYFDTDEETRANINQTEQVIDPADFINLGDTNPYKVYDQAVKGSVSRDNDPKFRRVTEWASSQELGHITFPNRSLSDGAMAQRMVGRTALAQHHDHIKKALVDRLAEFQAHKDAGSRTVESDIWVVASSCGGTGSSLTLDILYLINRITNEQQTKDAFVKLVLFMPEPFIEHNKGVAHEVNNHIMNGYSFMWELNALKQHTVDGGKDIFSYFSAYPWGYSPDEQFDLCRFVVPVDVETNRNTKIGLNEIYATTAEMIYYLNIGSGAGKIVSNLCNDIVKAAKASSSLTQFADTPFKWGTWLVPYGYHVIRKADIELKEYLRTRARLEILRDGLLGESIDNQPKVVDEEKKKFAAEYILPYLVDFGNMAAGEDSVQSHINDELNVGKLNPDGLDANRVKGYLRRIDEALEDTDTIKDTYLEKIKTSVNKGIGKMVSEHGLRFTVTLLNNVDDFYLTQLNSGTLANMEAEAEGTADELLREIEAHLGKGIGKKNASAVAQAAKQYFEACKQAAGIKIARNIITALTEFPDGYLELVRKGNGIDHLGLQKLVDMVNAKVSDATSAYSALAKKFIDSQNDALTLYLPSLASIASGEDGTWARNSDFEKLYYSSILDYDHERVRKSGDDIVPVRTNGGNNNLTYYIQQLLLRTDLELFVNMSLEEPVRAQTTFEKIIDNELNAIISTAINAEGTPANTWLKRTLEEYVTLNKKDIDFETLTNPDLIPVLYPMKASHTDATLTRYLYVGASTSLAQQFGFRPNTENTEFVEDRRMTDRFQIIKLPVGVDFYSYKYFNKIQEHYFKHRKGVLSEQEGCHIHKAFRFLDMNKAQLAVRQPANLEAIRYFIKNLYYQQLVWKLKEKEPAAYRELMGSFDVLSFMADTPAPAATDSDELDISAFLGGGTPASSGAIDLGSSTVSDQFISARLKLVNPLGIDIVMHNAGIDTSGHLYAENSEENFTLDNVPTPQLLAEGLLRATSRESTIALMSMLTKIDQIEKVLLESSIKGAVDRVKGDARNAVLTADKQNPNFAILVNAWVKQQNPDNEIFLNEIRQFLNTITR